MSELVLGMAWLGIYEINLPQDSNNEVRVIVGKTIDSWAYTEDKQNEYYTDDGVYFTAIDAEVSKAGSRHFLKYSDTVFNVANYQMFE